MKPKFGQNGQTLVSRKHSLSASHWSEAKQLALADQFFDTLKQLDALGVQQIHLALAAQSSVVFNLGRRYDKRNLPRVVVYQFEKGQGTRYPWASRCRWRARVASRHGDI
jgi:hypothetical protein